MQSSLKKHAFGMIGILILQYLLGVITNLFVKFPDNDHDGQLWEFAWHQVPVALHIIVGFLLFFGTVALLYRAFRSQNKVWKISASVSAIAILSAIVAGSLFISSQKDADSFIMAFAFIIALFSYGWGIYYS